MIPISDDNPTRRPAVVTVGVIVACVWTFVFVQPGGTRSLGSADAGQQLEVVEFVYEYAAIPCELAEGRPLTVEEVVLTQRNGQVNACLENPTTKALFPQKSMWRSLLVSMFLHGSWLHLGVNMVAMWVFGNNVEDRLGSLRFAVFYVASGVIATQAHVVAQLDSTVPIVGASGAVAGAMGAYLVWFPRARVRTLVLLAMVPLWPRIPAAIVLSAWFVLQFFTGTDSGVAWVAHVGGFVFGFVVASTRR